MLHLSSFCSVVAQSLPEGYPRCAIITEPARGAVGNLPADALTHWSVDRRVGNVRNDDETLVNPA
ncbi:hypothetical protein [Modicisalibacter coralii]|uniref:hypothetical protein n=1 Tax=Modicisalibacter coralii TaxID=2304602 RepID=UPI00100A3FE1|nr:hypothetical protein [Halomonas coralii]